MSNDACVLTTRDFTLLQQMLNRSLGRDDPMRALLTRKLDGATVVGKDAVADDVATLNSRVSFRANDGLPQSRILTRDYQGGSVGLALAVTTPRGLALLGLTVGQSFILASNDRLMLDEVLYQPEGAGRNRALFASTPVLRQRPKLRLIQGSGGIAAPVQHSGYPDDPGPSAA
ncbi:nucleoside-diphosphate kinase [Tianweitania populi]|uniref:Nucleoside-diphosphate kinase n=2 Tax=Tianweitania populi TaxID=1607949 RepID=A0A8J3DTG9_9HYPH|nr:nucleoside-diphosphate kinase [Tianweitania populi]